MTALIISNEEMEDVMKIVESHEESALLKVLVKQLELKQKKKIIIKGRFPGTLLGTLA